MPPRRKARPPCRHAASDSDSSSDGRGGHGRQLSLELYTSLQLGQALQRPGDFATAVGELAALLRELYGSGRCDKSAQAAMAQDAALAIEACDSRLQSRSALAALMEAAERHLPQAKRIALLRRYRQSGVQLARRDRRQGTGGWLGDDAGDEAAAPATFAYLPSDVIRLVFQRLDPLMLARAACVSREWRGAASEGALWQAHCAALAGPGRSSSARPCANRGGAKGNAGAGVAAGGQQRPGGTAGSAQGSSWRERFAALAAQHPERLQRWKTRRVLVAGRLVWLSDGEPLPAMARHVGPEAIVAFCRSGGRLARSAGSSQSDSDSSDSDGGGADGRLTGRLRFWQL